MRKIATVFCAATLLFIAGSCAPSIESGQPTNDYPKKSIELIAPAGSGGEYDLTIRSIAQCLLDTKLVSVPLPVTNMPGGGGIAALAYLDEKKGANDVSRDSSYTTINEVMDALKEDPHAVTIGGISAPGSMDHIQFLKMAHKDGVTNLRDIKYVGFQDGTAAAQLVGGHVDLISTGISDSIGLVESGDIRALATTAESRVGSGIVGEIPTCMEQGIDATFYNWRGIFGPKDMPEYAIQYWEDILGRMSQTEQWERICMKYGWEMTFSSQDDFADFLDDVNEEYAVLLEEIGYLG